MSNDIVRQLEAMNAKVNEVTSTALVLTNEESESFDQLSEQTLSLMHRLFETDKEGSDAHRH